MIRVLILALLLVGCRPAVATSHCTDDQLDAAHLEAWRHGKARKIISSDEYRGIFERAVALHCGAHP